MSNNHFDLWVEKYRPKTIDEYVFKDDKMKQKIVNMIQNPDNKRIPIPHLLFAGHQGAGKTSLAKLILLELDVDPGDILDINASRENSIDDVRTKIVNFASTWPLGEFKVVLLDEADQMTPQAQKVLRGEMERYADTVRFILTCNYPRKILPAIHSRLQTFVFESLDMEEFVIRIVTILENEGVEFDPDVVNDFVNNSYPDLRKCINLLDQHTWNKTLHPYTNDQDSVGLDWIVNAVPLLEQGKVTEARQMICSQISGDEYEEVFRYFYQNLQLWSKKPDGQAQAILIIAQGLRDHALTADPEINLASTMVQLSQIQ